MGYGGMLRKRLVAGPGGERGLAPRPVVAVGEGSGRFVVVIPVFAVLSVRSEDRVLFNNGRLTL